VNSEKDPITDIDTNQEYSFYSLLYIIIYWTIYVLSWIIIPLAQEFEKAGDFTTKEKFKRAVKRNLVSYGIFAALGASFVIYLIIQGRLTR
jgi:hypothetical protein